MRLWEEGLIYQGDYIVNWCPRCQTVLSDLEVEREERDAEFVYIKYGPLTLGTVRPETKVGDTGLAVHPEGQALHEVRRARRSRSPRWRERSRCGRRRQRRRPEVRHRGHQGHARPRSDGLRDRAAPRPARAHGHRLRREDDGARGQVRRPRPLRGPAGASSRTCRPSGSSIASSPTATPWGSATAARRWWSR